MNGQIVHVFTPIGGTWKSYTLKHWFGKRVTYRGRYGKITEMQLDRDMNFVCWRMIVNGKIVNLKDPNFR